MAFMVKVNEIRVIMKLWFKRNKEKLGFAWAAKLCIGMHLDMDLTNRIEWMEWDFLSGYEIRVLDKDFFWGKEMRIWIGGEMMIGLSGVGWG